MMKNLIMIRGAMGVGKTTVSRELQKLLPNAVFLDGDWCWNANPLVVNDETKTMVLDNIIHLLTNFLTCSAYKNIIFCWVMQDRNTVLDITEPLSYLQRISFRVFEYSLVCGKESLRQRLAGEIAAGLREPDIINRSLEYLPLYKNAIGKIDVSDISAKETAEIIADMII